LLVYQSSPTFFSPNAGGIAVDQVVFRLSIYRPIPKIFAMTVRSCSEGPRNSKARLPKICTKIFLPCLAAHHVSSGPEVDFAHTLNLAPISEFLLSPNFSSGAPKYLDLTYKAEPIYHHLTKFHADRLKSLGDFVPKWKKAITPKMFLWGIEAPTFWDYISKGTHFRSPGKASRRSAEGARRYSAAKWQKLKKKHQQ